MLLPEEILSYISTTVDSGIGATFGIARVRRTCSSCCGVLKPRLRPGWAKVVEQRPCHDCRVAIDAGEDISVRCAWWRNGDNFASRGGKWHFYRSARNSTLIVVGSAHHHRDINFFPRETRENTCATPGNNIGRRNVNYIIEASNCCDFENPLLPAVVDSIKPTGCRSFILT